MIHLYSSAFVYTHRGLFLQELKSGTSYTHQFQGSRQKKIPDF